MIRDTPKNILMKTMKLYLFFPVLAFLFAAGCGTTVKMPEYADNAILVTAHRATHDSAPENSLTAIRHSIRDQIDIVEIDVRVTRDSQLVLMHDGTIDRTTTGSGAVEEMYWADLKEEFLLHQGKPTKERIPTFREALLLGRGKVVFDLDLKTEKIDLVMQVVEEAGSAGSVIFFDSDWSVLEQVLAAHPDWHLMPRAYNPEMAKEAYEKFKPWAIHVDPSFASTELSQYFHDRGVFVWINALGKVDEALEKGDIQPFLKLLETNPNIIQTDHPVKVKQLTRNRALDQVR